MQRVVLPGGFADRKLEFPVRGSGRRGERRAAVQRYFDECNGTRTDRGGGSYQESGVDDALIAQIRDRERRCASADARDVARRRQPPEPRRGRHDRGCGEERERDWSHGWCLAFDVGRGGRGETSKSGVVGHEGDELDVALHARRLAVGRWLKARVKSQNCHWRKRLFGQHAWNRAAKDGLPTTAG